MSLLDGDYDAGAGRGRAGIRAAAASGELPDLLDFVRVPDGTEGAWTAAELTGILRKLRKQGRKTPLGLGSRPSSRAPTRWCA
ncbi:hypothetical protein [Streptomyces coacervatus]|uniref:hypothetical protein n=1 Tax=Streptomyces coacervatus TaxID=647381 RepID=UPI0023DC5B04|nr:hypothetical protein [Streptomyces coacervatus]